MKHIVLFLFIFQFSLIRAQLWQNDFSNASEWISADLNAGTDQWIISANGIGGEVDSINSASAGNGFAQFNSEGQCNGNHQDVVLTYFQTIDISANELSYLEFVQHYKRNKDTVYVEFSHDGLTWESIRVNQKYWFNQQTDNPDTVRVSIPASVQSQPFYLRFKYSGEFGFAWLIDDVKIFEKEQYAIIASEKLVQDDISYLEIAICQIDLMESKVHLTNFGYDTLFNVKIQIDKFKDGVFDNTYLEIVDTILPQSETTVITAVLDGSMASTYDFYQYEYKIYSDELDTLFMTDSIYISETEMKHTGFNQMNYFKTNANEWGLGNKFISEQEFCISNAKVFIPDTLANVNQFIFFIAYKVINGNIQYYSVTQDFLITNSELGQWVNSYYMNWDVEPIYYPGDTGIIVISTYGSEFLFEYSDNSTGSYTLTDLFVVEEFVDGRMVNITLNSYDNICRFCGMSIQENSFGVLSIHPNPATEFIALDTEIELEEIQIFSLDGKQVYASFDFDQNNIPVSFLERGMYIIKTKDVTGNYYTGRFVKG